MQNLVLIPPKYLEREKIKKKKLYVLIAAVASFIVISLLCAIPYKIQAELKNEKAYLEEKISRLEEVYVKGQQYDSIYFMYKQRESIAQKMNTKGIDVPTIFSHLEKNAPENLALTNIGISQDSGMSAINITGMAATKNDIATFVSSLEKDGYFLQVTINSISANDNPTGDISNNVFGLKLKISH